MGSVDGDGISFQDGGAAFRDLDWTLAAIALLVVLLHEILLPFVAGSPSLICSPPWSTGSSAWVNRTVAALGIVGVFIIGVGGVLVLSFLSLL